MAFTATALISLGTPSLASNMSNSAATPTHNQLDAEVDTMRFNDPTGNLAHVFPWLAIDTPAVDISYPPRNTIPLQAKATLVPEPVLGKRKRNDFNVTYVTSPQSISPGKESDLLSPPMLRFQGNKPEIQRIHATEKLILDTIIQRIYDHQQRIRRTNTQAQPAQKKLKIFDFKISADDSYYCNVLLGELIARKHERPMTKW